MMIRARDYLFLGFGLPTWILVDGTWAALSQIALVVPEGFNISSFLMLALTSGNLFPLFIGNYLRGCSPETLKVVIFCILVLSFLSGIFLSIFWSSTITIHKRQYSVPLYVIFFIIGSCSSSSNITHFMFVSKYPARLTSMLSTGFGFGSMIAGIFALLQGLLLKEYGISLLFYFLLLSATYIPAVLCFYILSAESNQSILSINNIEYLEIENVKETMEHTDNVPMLESKSDTESGFLRDHYRVLILQFISAIFGYGLVPSIISFACSKFDHRDTILLLSTSITSASSPWFRMLTEYVDLKSEFELLVALLVLLFLGFGVLICALLPDDEQIYKGYGGIFPATFYILFNGLFGFTSTCIFRYYKSHVTHRCVQHAYRWGGLAMQSGALIGSVTTFLLIIDKVFQ